MSLLRVENLQVDYFTPDGSLRAVDKVSFELKRGADGEFAATLVIPPVQFDEQTTE